MRRPRTWTGLIAFCDETLSGVLVLVDTGVEGQAIADYVQRRRIHIQEVAIALRKRDEREELKRYHQIVKKAQMLVEQHRKKTEL